MKVVKNPIFKLSCIGALLSAVLPGTLYAETESERAEKNRQILSCYAEGAQAAYDKPFQLSPICDYFNYGGQVSPKGKSIDDRNGMGAWYPSAQQPQPFADVIKFFERENGNRKELLIAYRGSKSAGDFLQDARSQIFVAHSVSPTAISAVTAPEDGHSGARINAGFFARVENTASVIDDKLTELENWLNNDPNRELGIKITGHSLGAAASTIGSYYVANRYLDNPRVDVEAFAFNSPRVGNTAFLQNINSRASTCSYNIRVIDNHGDVVSAVPLLSGPSLHALHGARHPNFADEDCAYVKGMRIKHKIFPILSFGNWHATYNELNTRNTYHEISQWLYDADADGYNSQRVIKDAQINAIFPQRAIGSHSNDAQWQQDFVSIPGGFVTTDETEVSDSILSEGVRHLQAQSFDSERWNHDVILNKGELVNSNFMFTGDSGYRVGFQWGRLRVYQGSTEVWSSGSGNRILLQDDGNLVVSNNNTATWNSGTADTKADFLVLTHQGHLVLMTEAGEVVHRLYETPDTCPPSVCFDDGIE